MKVNVVSINVWTLVCSYRSQIRKEGHVPDTSSLDVTGCHSHVVTLYIFTCSITDTDKTSGRNWDLSHLWSR